ncbi:MAG: methionyl-tRNA formyltransferase [Eggerthellales bacterium]|nr:methionyl-tRNA formyltransferase [Eggerthellales bacterium]
MRIVYMGSPRFAAHVLESLVGQHEIAAVFTRSDKVSSRGSKPVPTPVRQVADAHHIPVHTPHSLKDDEVYELLASYKPEVIVVAAYSKLLPKRILDLPTYGCLNVHASLLPRWRGAAPVQRGILAQDQHAGVCIMRMEESLDTGDYCVCRETEIGEKTAIALTDELADLGGAALLHALPLLPTGQLTWTSQDDSQAVYAPKIEKGELFIGPEMSAVTVRLHVQASTPAHPAKCVIASRSVTVLDARLVQDPELIAELHLLHPGRVMLFRKRLFAACADGYVEVLAVRPDGKKSMDAKAFAAGIQNIKSGLITWEALS